MEAVVNDEHVLGTILLNRLEEGSGHVDGNGAKLGAHRAQAEEERTQRGGVFAVADMEHLARVQVDHDDQKVIGALDEDLVYGDAMDATQSKALATAAQIGLEDVLAQMPVQLQVLGDGR